MQRNKLPTAIISDDFACFDCFSTHSSAYEVETNFYYSKVQSDNEIRMVRFDIRTKKKPYYQKLLELSHFMSERLKTLLKYHFDTVLLRISVFFSSAESKLS